MNAREKAERTTRAADSEKNGRWRMRGKRPRSCGRTGGGMERSGEAVEEVEEERLRRGEGRACGN
jgi:hypothetical protein